MKGTKRMSHGLQVNGTFTWSKALQSVRTDIFNPVQSKSIQSTDQPFLFNANILYETQKWFKNRYANVVYAGWQLGAFLQYGSGMPLLPPAANIANNLGTSQMVRTGQPLFLKDLNCGCINYYTDQVLNPAAWTNPAAGTFGPGPAASLYYTDFRQARRPQENFNIGRNFRIKERMSLQIRAEFSNIFNRTQVGNPITTNPVNNLNVINPLTKNSVGNTAGFGVYTLANVLKNSTPSLTANGVVNQLFSQPRQGTLVARFTF
jgi:hypothetical protein